MRSALTAAVLAGLIMAGFWAGSSRAAEAEVTVDVASSYVFRGVTFNDGTVIQPGFSISGLPIAIGVWGNLDVDDYDGTLESSQFSEVDLYASYDVPLDMEDIGVSVGYCEYLYPSAGGDADREVSTSFSLDSILAPSVTFNYGIDGAIDKSLYIETGVSHGMDVTEEVSVEASAALGYADIDEGESGFSHFQVGLSASYGIVTAGITYIGQIDDDVLPDATDTVTVMDPLLGAVLVPGDLGYDSEIVATIGISHTF